MLNDQLWTEAKTAPGNDLVRMRRARVRPEYGTAGEPIFVATPFVIEFEYWNQRAGAHSNLSLHVYNEQGVLVFNARPWDEAVWRGRPFPQALFRDRCHVPGNLLNDGVHRVELLVVADSRQVIHRMDDVLVFEVRDVGEDGDGSYDSWAGAVRPRLEWETEQLITVDSGPRSDD